MLSKIKIKSELEILSGLHIGGNSAFSAIGAVDSPVVKDVLTKDPYIPGSSLKGKMRYLLAKKYNDVNIKPNKTADGDNELICRLFGKSNSSNSNSMPSRLIFNDTFINKENKIDLLENKSIESLTEVKFENNIDRITAMANPRQIERVIRGAIFDFSILYNAINIEDFEIKEDFKLLYDAFYLLEDDYIGGSGTRGYGRIKFNNMTLEFLEYGDKLDDSLKNELNIINDDFNKKNVEIF